MRRLLVVAALFALAACSDKPPAQSPGGANQTTPGSTASAPGGSPTPGASMVAGVPGGADKKTVCAAYTKAEGEAGAKLVTILPKAAEAMGDPGKAPAVITELKAALAEYEKGLAAEANRSADGELRGAIEADLGTIKAAQRAIETAGNDMEKVINALNSPEFQKIGDRVKTLCEAK